MSDKNKDVINEINKAYQEASASWRSYFLECDEDHKFYNSKQWEGGDHALLKKKKLPTLNLNQIFRIVNVLVGLQKQNQADLVSYPVEGGDQITADILSKVMHWIMANNKAQFKTSDEYKNEIIGGLGYLYVSMDYSRDSLFGDISIKNTNPFNVLLDPHTTQKDLSDCNYIIYHQFVEKAKLKSLYPEYADEIETMKASAVSANSFDYRRNETQNDRAKHLLVKEMWYRSYEQRKFIINTEEPLDSQEYKGDPETLQIALRANPHLRLIKKGVDILKLRILVGEDLIVYDGDSPYGLTLYPFIPLWGFLDMAAEKWEDKLQGIVRVLKDPQREKNKRRSSIMLAINSMPHALWLADKGAVDDQKKLLQAGAGAKYIEKNPGRNIQQVPAPQMPQGLYQLEQMFSNDIMNLSGVNPDMLGQMNSSGDTGKMIQLRLQQGLATIAELPDNLTYALRLLGLKIIELIKEKWTESTDKLQRICGQDIAIPEDFLKSIQNTVYDIEVDITSHSPTHRFQVYSQLQESRQYGIDVPFESILEYTQIPQQEKDKIIQNYQNMQQQQLLMAQAQAQANQPPTRQPIQTPEAIQ